MKSSYLIIAHGSREKQANEEFQEFLGRFRKAYPHREVSGAFLELSKPTIPEELENCIVKGSEEIFVIPLMFFSGRHVKEDIPRFIEEAKAKHPQVDFHYAGPLANHPALMDLLDKQANTVKGTK